MAIKERLRERREALGISGRELGRRAGVAESHVGLIESGSIESPRVDTVEALAKVLECGAAWLLFGSGDPPIDPVPAEPDATDGGDAAA